MQVYNSAFHQLTISLFERYALRAVCPSFPVKIKAKLYRSTKSGDVAVRGIKFLLQDNEYSGHSALYMGKMSANLHNATAKPLYASDLARNPAMESEDEIKITITDMCRLYAF